jgi:predicted aspartyl protease
MFAEVEFRLVGGEQPLIVIPASVAGRGPFDFVLDTGAGTSLLSPRLASVLDIIPTGTREGRGAAGKVTVALASASSLSIGAAYRAPWPVGITAEVERIAAAVDSRIDGCIGYDFLKDFRVGIDYRRRLVRLAQGAYETAGQPSHHRAEIPFRLAAPTKPLVMVPAFIAGQGPYAFAVDTGASTTVISPELARSLSLEQAPSGPVTAAGGVITTTMARVASLSVGTARRGHLAVLTADFLGQLGAAVGTTVDGVLGYNFLRHFRVTIDYPELTLWLTAAG